MACHGPEGKGNPAGRAQPDQRHLALRRHAGATAQTLTKGRNGQMPAFGNSLGEDKIHLVTAYIYGLNQ
jgi:cytochrome c oxidase cbb3-type subunit 3